MGRRRTSVPGRLLPTLHPRPDPGRRGARVHALGLRLQPGRVPTRHQAGLVLAGRGPPGPGGACGAGISARPPELAEAGRLTVLRSPAEVRLDPKSLAPIEVHNPELLAPFARAVHNGKCPACG